MLSDIPAAFHYFIYRLLRTGAGVNLLEPLSIGVEVSSGALLAQRHVSVKSRCLRRLRCKVLSYEQASSRKYIHQSRTLSHPPILNLSW